MLPHANGHTHCVHVLIGKRNSIRKTEKLKGQGNSTTQEIFNDQPHTQTHTVIQNRCNTSRTFLKANNKKKLGFGYVWVVEIKCKNINIE